MKLRQGNSTPIVELASPPILPFALVILSIVVFWLCYILIAKVKCIYGVQEIEVLRKSSFLDLLSIMDFGTYKRFTPLGLGLWGYLDIHVLVPLLGQSADSDISLASAGRLLWLHLLFLTAACACSALVSWKIFRSTFATTLVVLLIGLNDAVPFQFRFASTLLCYQLQIVTMFAIYFLAVKEQGRWSFAGVVGCIVFALLLWEQGLNLAVSICVYLAIAIFLNRREKRPTCWDVYLCSTIAAITIAYVILRTYGGSEESLSSNREASYFFSYKNPLLMLDDLVLNFSALVEQSIRQLFPFPGESFAVILKKDMNQLNVYNTTYSQFPNMPYRMVGLWLSGFCFAVFWFLLALTLYFGRRSHLKHLVLLSTCIFVCGFTLHLPVMHRDYFYIPGYALGYKASVSYVGFVFIVAFLATAIRSGRFARSLPHLMCRTITLYGYLAAAAVVRAIALTLPQRFPW